MNQTKKEKVFDKPPRGSTYSYERLISVHDTRATSNRLRPAVTHIKCLQPATSCSAQCKAPCHTPRRIPSPSAPARGGEDSAKHGFPGSDAHSPVAVTSPFLKQGAIHPPHRHRQHLAPNQSCPLETSQSSLDIY